MKKKITTILLLVLVLLTVLPVVTAAAPYSTYTYTQDGTILLSPDAYVPDVLVDVNYMELKAYLGEHSDIANTFDFEGDYDVRDIFVGPDQKVYIVDGDHGAVLVLDRYYKVERVLNSFINEYGVPDTFSGPSGVFVNNEKIYVCDTGNNRIVMFDKDCNYLKIINKPEDGVFEEGTIYKPIACAVDEFGRLFVISSTTYEGVIVINEDSEFYGFIGAQKDTVSVFQAFLRSFQTEEQRAQTALITSKELNNITIDKDGFVYVTTSSIDEGMQQSQIEAKSKDSAYAPVKKLNSSGVDVMRRNGVYPPSGEVKVATNSQAEIQGASTIVDVAVGPEGTWSIIDQKRSKVFTYDENGNLLFAFGDKGDQVGNIAMLNGIAYQGDKMLLLDKQNDCFVVYRRTEYGDLLMQALANDNNRQYDRAIDDWTEILKRNNNYEVAYVQIGKALYRDAKYEESINYFKSIKETENYSLSYKEIRKNWASKYFWILPIVIVAAAVGIFKFFAYTRKVNKRASLKIGRRSLKEELLYAFHVIFHPFDGFWDLKHEKRGSVKSATIILMITVLAFFYRSIGSGYIINQSNTKAQNVVGTILAVILPLALWAIANWCLTTLFDGEGSMKDIYIACCYALTPLPMFMIPLTIFSNFIVKDEAGIINIISTIAFLWLGLLVFFGMMVTHDYSPFKSILTSLGTIVGMMFLMFLGLLFTTLMSQIIKFVTNIATEIGFRL
ncbi:MAG: YIP1 family protein [Clostridia bacterium]|nr:YIP1 family protein [Clostridia bacterium]